MNARLAVGMVLALGGGSALAADWNIDPRIAVSGVYNDNNRLTEIPGSEIEVTGARIDAQVTFRGETPRSSLQLVPRLRSSFYPGDSSEEANDQFLRLLARHATERTALSFDVGYSRVDTLGSYFPGSTVGDDDVLGDPDRGAGVGRLGLKNREDRLSLVPMVSFELSERQALEFRAEYLDTSYDFQVPGDRIDYKDLLGSVAFSRALSTTSGLTLRATYSIFDPDDGDETDTQGLDLEWRNRMSETAEYYLRGGANRVELESVTPGGSSSWETGFTGGAGVRWTFEVTDIFLDVSRNLDPNSSGDLVTRDQVRAQWSRRLTPMARLTVGGRLISDSAPGNDQSFQDRTYAAASIGFDWRIARAWTLFGSYDHAWREYDNAPTDARSNAVNIGIIYEPNRR
jgi:hypothetical protein